jgi:hypothetical protein
MTAGKLVPKMKQLRQDGVSKRAIAKQFGVSRTSVIRSLRRRKRKVRATMIVDGSEARPYGKKRSDAVPRFNPWLVAIRSKRLGMAKDPVVFRVRGVDVV